MPDLYDFQQAGRDFLANTGRACLFDEMGLGKTPQALTAAQQTGARTILIVVPSFAIATWHAEIEKWFPELAGSVAVVSGERDRREDAWERWAELRGDLADPRALITTYRHLPEVAACGIPFDLAIYDEAHAISNRKTVAFKAARKIKSRCLFVLTGTPTRKSPEEFWCYLSLIDPKRFSSYWRFIDQHFLVEQGRWGKEIIGLSNPAGFREMLKPYTLRRLKADVLTELPPLTRQHVLVELTPLQRSLYDQMAEELLIEWEGSMLAVSNKLALLTRLRQLTVCPAVLGLECQSALIDAAQDIAGSALSSGGKVVIFCPFRQCCPDIGKRLPPCRSFYVHGEQDRETNAGQIAMFQVRPGPAVLLATIQMAASWSANAASVCLFVGCSFSPIEHAQAEGRLHRHGQQNAVTAYYIGGKGTVDESIAEVLTGKVALAELVLDPKRLIRL